MKIVFFDGHCNLCNRFIDFLMRHSHREKIFVASLQGETAKKYQLPVSAAPETIIYVREDQQFQKSTAALQIISDLGGAWVSVKIFLLIPKFIRDRIYDLVARNRYSVFGRTETCRVPTSEEKARFLP